MLTLAAYLHRLDPFAIQFTESFGLRWYGLSYLAGFIAAYLLIRHLARTGRSTLNAQAVVDLVFAVAIGTVVGGRLGYCVFYQPSLLVSFEPGFPFWGVLKLNQGGMASHGGVIGIVIACLLFARKHKVSSLHLLDLCAVSGGIGVFFGRIANFVNGELVGRRVDEAFPLAVKFPQDLPYVEFTDNAQLAAFAERIDEIGAAQLGFTGEQFQAMATAAEPGQPFTDAVNRIITLTQQRTPAGDAMAAAIEPLLIPRHPSQVYQALGEGLLMFAILMLVWLRPRKPGVIGAWFLMSYAVLRIIGEQFRQPDAHIGYYDILGAKITQGQWLSFVMLSAGAALLWYWARRPVPKLGGWFRPAPPNAPAKSSD